MISNMNLTQQQQTQPISSDATIGEKGLYLLNNAEEWGNLMKHLRTSGVTTNAAARMKIIKYLSQNRIQEEKPKPSEKSMPDNDFPLESAKNISCENISEYHKEREELPMMLQGENLRKHVRTSSIVYDKHHVIISQVKADCSLLTHQGSFRSVVRNAIRNCHSPPCA